MRARRLRKTHSEMAVYCSWLPFKLCPISAAPVVNPKVKWSHSAGIRRRGRAYEG